MALANYPSLSVVRPLDSRAWATPAPKESERKSSLLSLPLSSSSSPFRRRRLRANTRAQVCILVCVVAISRAKLMQSRATVVVAAVNDVGRLDFAPVGSSGRIYPLSVSASAIELRETHANKELLVSVGKTSTTLLEIALIVIEI